uniref:Uncharacterized protein n=1 Tax=Solanum lycopersicum TaxID=4081 RepID=A0A3Q7G1Q8_SOLLC
NRCCGRGKRRYSHCYAKKRGRSYT